MQDIRAAAKASQQAKIRAMGINDKTSESPGAQTVKRTTVTGSAQTCDTQRIPTRATGGRVDGDDAVSNLGMTPRSSGKPKAKTVVNVIVAPQQSQPAPMPMPPPDLPMPGPGPAAGPPMPPPGGMPPGMPMPMRANGGRVDAPKKAFGGKVGGGSPFKGAGQGAPQGNPKQMLGSLGKTPLAAMQGAQGQPPIPMEQNRAGMPMQPPTDGQSMPFDRPMMGSTRPVGLIGKKSGGAVAPKMTAGALSGEGRLQKTAAAKRDRK